LHACSPAGLAKTVWPGPPFCFHEDFHMSSTEQKTAAPWTRLEAEPGDSHAGLVNVVIESPRGSRCKYKFDEKQGLFLLHKLLPLGSSFPYAFGFIPSTLGEDGDPLDVLVLLGEPLFTGCVAPIRLIGVLEAEQTDSDGKTVRNDRLIGVVETLVNPAEPTALEEVGEQTLREIEHFFVSYNEIEGRQFKCLGRGSAKQALALVEKGRSRAQRNSAPKSNGKRHSGPQNPGEPPRKSDRSSTGEPAPADPGKPPAKGGGFALKPGKSFRRQVRRLARRQLDKALRDLCRLGATADEAIHDVRKRFKRVRAVLRLIRDELGDKLYCEENQSLRDAAAAFSEVRNARVLVDAVGPLRHRNSEVPSAAFDALEQFLKARQRDIHDRLARNVESMDQLREAIERGRRSSSAWPLPENGRRTIRRGLRRTCKAGRDALDDAQKARTSEHLHECRKQAKYLYHQVQLLGRVASPAVQDLVEQLHELEETLGEDHDLGMLRVEVVACIAGGMAGLDDRLVRLIDGCRAELQDHSLQLAQTIYGEDRAGMQHRFRERAKQLFPKQR
jgi:inorganic pyrophosphatase